MNKIKKSMTDRAIATICNLVSLFCLFIFLYPLIYVIVSSFCPISGRRGLSLIPNYISFEGYKAVFENKYVWQGLINSIIYTSVGTFFSMIISILSAYALAQRNFYCGKTITIIFIASMYFSGGMIPTYLLIKKLGMLNSMWSLILPSSMSIYNIFFVARTFSIKNTI